MLLAPVTASAAGSGQLGRAPISYFAPDPAFAVGADAGAAARELRQVISGFHSAELEVILQVRPFLRSPTQSSKRHLPSLHSLGRPTGRCACHARQVFI